MAKKPTHYKITVNRPIEIANTRLRPGARYMVKAAIHDQIKEQAADALASVQPLAG